MAANSWPKRFSTQLAALLRKSAATRARSWRTNFAQLFQSVFFILLIYVIALALGYSASYYSRGSKDERRTEATPVGSVPDCTTDVFLQRGIPCYDFLYAPAGNPLVESVVSAIRRDNQPPIPAARVMAMKSAAEVSGCFLGTAAVRQHVAVY